jgi:hypothetical protein
MHNEPKKLKVSNFFELSYDDIKIILSVLQKFQGQIIFDPSKLQNFCGVLKNESFNESVVEEKNYDFKILSITILSFQI